MPNTLGSSRLRFPDPVGSFFQGMRGVQELQEGDLRNQLIKQKMEEQERVRNALGAYGTTGDMRELMKVNPEAAIRLQQAQQQKQKFELEALKPVGDWAYANLEMGKDPKQYPRFRETIIKAAPMLSAQFPETFDENTPKLLDSYARGWEKIRKLQSDKLYNIHPGGALVGPGGNVLYSAPTMPKEWKPEYFEGEGGQGTWVTPGTTPPSGYKPAGKGGDKVKGVKWFQNPETGESKAYAYGETPPSGWKPIYKEGEQDIPKWALTQAQKALEKVPEFTYADPEDRQTMIFKEASSIMQQRERLRTGKKPPTAPAPLTQEEARQKLLELYQQGRIK